MIYFLPNLINGMFRFVFAVARSSLNLTHSSFATDTWAQVRPATTLITTPPLTRPRGTSQLTVTAWTQATTWTSHTDGPIAKTPFYGPTPTMSCPASCVIWNCNASAVATRLCTASTWNGRRPTPCTRLEAVIGSPRRRTSTSPSPTLLSFVKSGSLGVWPRSLLSKPNRYFFLHACLIPSYCSLACYPLF